MVKDWCASKTKISLRRALLHSPYYLEISKKLTMTLVGFGSVPISCSTYDMIWLNAGIQLSSPTNTSNFFLAYRISIFVLQCSCFSDVKIVQTTCY